jgi:hypothetical protein
MVAPNIFELKKMKVVRNKKIIKVKVIMHQEKDSALVATH